MGTEKRKEKKNWSYLQTKIVNKKTPQKTLNSINHTKVLEHYI